MGSRTSTLADSAKSNFADTVCPRARHRSSPRTYVPSCIGPQNTLLSTRLDTAQVSSLQVAGSYANPHVMTAQMLPRLVCALLRRSHEHGRNRNLCRHDSEFDSVCIMRRVSTAGFARGTSSIGAPTSIRPVEHTLLGLVPAEVGGIMPLPAA